MEVELMGTKRDDNRRRRQGEYRAICLGKVGRQSFAIGWNVQVAKWKRNSRVDLSPPRCYGPPPPQVDPVGGCTASNANITCHISSSISCFISCYIPRNCRYVCMLGSSNAGVRAGQD